jgi:hypothetical protein
MPHLRMLHVGGIEVGKRRITDSHKGNRNEIFYDLNSALFDYCYANALPIKQLPPLDDWTRSAEDANYWGYTIPELDVIVWIRTEFVEFK